MKAKEYEILARAVEEGVRHGIIRAFKHDDNPLKEHMAETVESEVLNAICEVFNFDPYIEQGD